MQNKLIINYNLYNLNPCWTTGYTIVNDCFMLSINPSRSNKIGYSARLKYLLSAGNKDKDILDNIFIFLKVGKTYCNGDRYY